MESGPPWWPGDLGQPAASGGQNDVRYAFFPDRRRLAVEQDGQVALYDSGDHRIAGVSQSRSRGQPLAFTTEKGEVTLDAPAIALGDLMLGQAGEEAGGGPALAIGTRGDVRPDLLDGGQPQVVQDEGEALRVDRLRGWLNGRGHAAAPVSRAS